MTPDDLKELCNNATKRNGPLILVVTRHNTPRGRKIRLLNTGGPLGMINNVREVGDRFEVCATFNPQEVLRYIEIEEEKLRDYSNRVQRQLAKQEPNK